MIQIIARCHLPTCTNKFLFSQLLIIINTWYSSWMLWKRSPKHASQRTYPMRDILLHGRVSGTNQGRFDIISARKRWRLPTLEKNILRTENLEISCWSIILHFQEHTSILYRIFNRCMFFIFQFPMQIQDGLVENRLIFRTIQVVEPQIIEK